jgi:ATP/ADP translocase
MTFVMIGILTGFLFMFQTGVAEEYPMIVYPMFFVVEEVVDSVLMVLFWQIGMLCFTKDEAKRLIGIVNMGAALANLANGVTVAVLIHYFSAFAILPAQMVLLLLQLALLLEHHRWL